jgi:hypothetical protein
MTRARIVVAAVAVSLAVTAGWLALGGSGDGDAASDDDGAIDPASEVRAARRHREREARRGRAFAARRDGRIERDADEVLATSGSAEVPGPLTAADAREGFDHVMVRIDELVAARTRLSPEEWEDTYRAANDAFAALSMHLDANDADDAIELEEAHARLRDALRRVRVRGRKQVP